MGEKDNLKTVVLFILQYGREGQLEDCCLFWLYCNMGEKDNLKTVVLLILQYGMK